ncbi:MAG: SDR family oxidoreductase [Candidatus Dormibacteria bacterium]
MRVVITGGTGFVGGNTARALLGAGHEVVLVSRGSRRVAPRQGLTAVRADVIAGHGLAEACAGADAVIHLTAVIRERGRQTFDAVIRRGTENVVAAARSAGVAHLVYISAIGADPDPRFGYLYAKWMAEQAIRASGLGYTTLRPSLIFGPGDGFFTTLCGLVRHSIPVVPIAGDGGALFQPISIDDVVRCILLALERGPSMSEIEIGGPEVLSYEGIVDIIHDAIGAGMRIKVHVPVPALMPAAAVMDRVLRNPPVTPAQLRMLARNNITRIDAVGNAFDFTPSAFSANAAYLRER